MTTILVMPPLSAKTALFSAPRAFRHFRFSEDMLSADFVLESLAGADMVRVGFSAKQPLGATSQATELLTQQRGHCRQLLATWKAPPKPLQMPILAKALSKDANLATWKAPSSNFAPQGCHVLGPTASVSASVQPPSAQQHILQLAQRLVSLPDHHATVADKDPSVMWLERTSSSFARVVHQLGHSGGRWSAFVGDRTSIVAYYRRIVDLVLPRQLRPARTGISLRNIPYCYPTVKDKCWCRDGLNAKHTCTQPNHSRLRVICSFYTLTVRKQLRLISRAVRFLLQVCWRTFECWDLSQAPQQLKTGIDQLEQRNISPLCPQGSCIMCAVPMLAPAVLVADAGQAYEAPEVRLIVASVDALFQSAEALQVPKSIFVHRGAKNAVGFGGSHKVPYFDRVVFYLYTLHRCLVGCLLLRMFVFGPLILLQNYGIPTGGPHSTVLLSILCGHREDIFIRFRWARILRTLGANFSLASSMFAIRYADDYCAISRCMCRQCLVKTLGIIYGGILDFKIETDFDIAGPTAAFNYLDVVVYVGFSWQRLCHYTKNELFYLTGLEIHRKKNRFRAFVSPFSRAVFQGWKADLSGRRARW
jgi:hypothetical protein